MENFSIMLSCIFSLFITKKLLSILTYHIVATDLNSGRIHSGKPNTIHASLSSAAASALFVESPLMDISRIDSICCFREVGLVKCFDLWLLYSRVSHARPSWRNGPIRCTSSLKLHRWRPTCLTWTAFCLISLILCSP